MPLPKRRHSNARTNKRRAHDALKVPTLSRCARCSQAVMPHRICPNCGYYRGRAVIDVERFTG
ncbi:MAG: 50S ribosomal protein L32 [Planctomycetes bacterium]|nr:50S ribosomal protein L32 [Planctomycetota bacterium]MBI3844642.1 50S ribosomal protein L32 [Planctomycetota bacterium]